LGMVAKLCNIHFNEKRLFWRKKHSFCLRMEVLKALVAVNSADEESKKFIIHETKYALLGTALFVLFLVPWTTDLIRNVFPMAKGPLLWVYKILFFFALYFIIQKTTWFQKM